MLGVTKFVWDRMTEDTRRTMLQQHQAMMLARLSARRAVAILKGLSTVLIDQKLATYTTGSATYDSAVNAVISGTVA
jgi:hypothetical protein